MTKKTGIVLIIIALVMVVVTITSVTYAFWSGNSEIGTDNTNSPSIDYEDNTYKYLVIEATTTVDNKSYFVYLTYDNSENYFTQDTSYNEKYGEEKYIITIESRLNNIKVIGYEGNLGEYEKINVPKSIPWGVGSSQASSNLTITELGFHSSEEFPKLHNIKSIVVPSTVTKISEMSFVYWGNLNAIYFKGSKESIETGVNTIFGTNGLKPLNTIKVYYSGSEDEDKCTKIQGVR